jgi:hypothetical protein
MYTVETYAKYKVTVHQLKTFEVFKRYQNGCELLFKEDI